MGFFTSASDVVTGLLRKFNVGYTIYFKWNGGKVQNYTFFSEDEVKGLDPELCAMLDMARGKAGVPFIITSGLRTQADNDALPESVKDSEHVTGNGVDISCIDSSARYAMLKGLLAAGFTRIGVYEKHLHAGNSKTLPQNVCWDIQSA